jgi:hypothetical protein
MKNILLLPAFVACALVSCKSVDQRDPKDPRPSAELTEYSAPQANKGLRHASKTVGQTATSGMDFSEDVLDAGGKVGVRQARDYTGIGYNTVSRGDDLVAREAGRYSDYAMDTVDGGADIASNAIERHPSWIYRLFHRGAGSTRKVTQSTLATYADGTEIPLFGVWKPVKPVEPKPWMVGSVNDQYPNRYDLPGAGWKGRPPSVPVVDDYSMASGGRATATK